MLKPKIKDLRIFGLIWTAICFGIGFYPVVHNKSLPILPLALGFVFLIISLYFPKALKWFYIVWVKLGEAIGFVVSRVILVLVFYIVVTPIGMIMRLFGKDLLNKKSDKKSDSYWIARQEQPGTMKNQY
jgi:hypothetical protein